MVKVRQDHPLQSGPADAAAWADGFLSRFEAADPERIRRAILALAALPAPAKASPHAWSEAVTPLQAGLEIVSILAELAVDDDTLLAGLTYRAVMEHWFDRAQLRERLGDEVYELHHGIELMETIGTLKLSDSGRVLEGGGEQVDNIRHMLVAMTDDVRVVLVKLAERTCALRAVRLMAPERGNRVARECLYVYAPLAHRLGIGQLRWEIEDLAFRHLSGAEYRRIARLIRERREDREHFIVEVAGQLTAALEQSGVVAEVAGRAKHIYSIWRKMQRKGVDFGRIYDVRAVRILLERESDCYLALGVVHSLWQHIPQEFDDYIASPKENGYRSIHTAVIGPAGKVLEVQIRTRAMHREAELGMCAHWAYKEDGKRPKRPETKIDWLRQVLEWHDTLGESEMLTEAMRRDLTEERIYVFTPDGDVLDLSSGCTPVDFAYRVHTQLGHRCRGARVDGRIVPLNYRLRSGQQVEILADETPQPQREWLNPVLGFVASSRARSKVLNWFRQRDRDKNISEGRRLLRQELARFGVREADLAEIAAQLGCRTPDDLLAMVGSGEVTLADAVEAAAPAERQQIALIAERDTELAGDTDAWEVRGAGRMPTHLARCCTPRPGLGIEGFVTASRTVTVHSKSCPQLRRLQARDPYRIIQLSWARRAPRTERQIRVIAYDRPGLMRDISSDILSLDVDLTAINSSTDKQTNLATVELTVEVHSNRLLGELMDRIGVIASVIDVRIAQ